MRASLIVARLQPFVWSAPPIQYQLNGTQLLVRDASEKLGFLENMPALTARVAMTRMCAEVGQGVSSHTPSYSKRAAGERKLRSQPWAWLRGSTRFFIMPELFENEFLTCTSLQSTSQLNCNQLGCPRRCVATIVDKDPCFFNLPRPKSIGTGSAHNSLLSKQV